MPHIMTNDNNKRSINFFFCHENDTDIMTTLEGHLTIRILLLRVDSIFILFKLEET